MVGWEVGIGHESISAPLIRIDDDAPVVRIEGLGRLAGPHLAATISGLSDWPLAGGVFALSGRAEIKRAPTASDLDFGAVSVDTMQRWTLPGVTVGIGPTWQRFRVAGRPFRDAFGLQAELTMAGGDDGHTAAFASLARQRHAPEFADLDALAAAWSLQHRIDRPFGTAGSIDLEIAAGRERNRVGRPEQGSRQQSARVAFEAPAFGLTWSAGLFALRARFDAPLIDGLPARRDRFRALDLGAALDLDQGQVLRLTWTGSRNAANLPLFESRQRQWSVTWASSR